MNLPDIPLTDQLWRNLVIAALILVVITPIIMTILAFRFNRMATKLNDIYCFFCYVGNWNEITPPDTLRLKRDLDKDMNIYAKLFSDDLSKKYNSFMLLCFVSKSGWEHDEKIKSLYKLRQEKCVGWDDDWTQYFDTNNVVEATRIKDRYDELIDSFKDDLVVLQYH